MRHVLVELEERGWEALSSTDGAAFCETWLADDAVLVVPGMIIDRATFLQAAGQEAPWAAHRIEEARVVQFMPGCEAVLYRVTASREGQPEYEALITSVYAKQHDDWKLVYHQQTPMP